jgi:ribosome maturation factor RimP
VSSGFRTHFFFWDLIIMDKQAIAQHIRAVAEKVAGDTETELVHVEVAGTNRELIVRIYIDKDVGVTLDDCSRFSRSVEAVLDEEDSIPVRYVLEVSSPGIERQLYSIRDFEKFTRPPGEDKDTRGDRRATNVRGCDNRCRGKHDHDR